MVFKKIQELKKKYSKEVFKEILNAVEEDIRFNRINFGKMTCQKEFLQILNTTENVFRRVYIGR
ncbi:hypothetical protein N2W53_000598 [Clostridium perfringens]|uniref:hypothetical protein n=1 Tax=Clostridium perfringens TaxID=1502 RepID=UPI0029128295|nr:hypothetical protein [Clostridium perfringens]EJT6170049.1 hypothetical protein [Clostridium perfringens]EJT6540771.1 hypothetical protein [Clostridium perfringens]EJT6565778.1 hypothetical protein [Clostridium perfringens]MBS5993667.1 hypothetical protein [Clostridium perfringens]MDU5658884.1 hypothetical protein [Clostridium perfringens]